MPLLPPVPAPEAAPQKHAEKQEKAAEVAVAAAEASDKPVVVIFLGADPASITRTAAPSDSRRVRDIMAQILEILIAVADPVVRPPANRFDSATLERSFTVRAGEGFIDLLGAALMERIHRAAPAVQLRFTPKADWDAQPLRDGTIDLEIGTVRTSAPEMLTRLLIRDRYVGVCRPGHPLLNGHGAGDSVGMERWVAYAHVLVARFDEAVNPVDAALAQCGSQRRISMVVPSYTSAMQVARRSDLLAVIPHSCLGNAFAPDHVTANGLAWFELPVSTPRFNVSAIWHPRLDHDPAQRWLRAQVLEVCLTAYPQHLPDAQPPLP